MAREHLTIRPAPLAAGLIEVGDIVLTDPVERSPQRTLGTVKETEDRRGTLTITIATSPVSNYTIITRDYERPVWVHVPTGQKGS